MISLSDIQGHWVRHWIKAPGMEDHTTRVHWIQSGRDYADIRIPLERPDLRGATSLADLSAPTLLTLARAEGFAGYVTLDGDRCTWAREINWHGKPDRPDIGRISFDQSGCLVEEGVLATYAELWKCRGPVERSAIRFANNAYSGLLVCAGDTGVLGIGQTEKPSTTSMLSALEAGEIPDGIGTLFDGFHALCRLDGANAVAMLATHPLIEGTPVLSMRDECLVWHKLGFDGTRTDIALHFAPVPA